MPKNVENTRAEGDFAQESPKTGQKMPEKPINTRAEDAFKKDASAEEIEKECREQIAGILDFFQETWKEDGLTDAQLELLEELAEGITRKLKTIYRARIEERNMKKWQEMLKIFGRRTL